MKKIIVLVFLVLESFNICFSQSGWYQLQSGTTYSFKDVYFINEQTGWAVSDSARVFMTNTGGSSWTMQRIGTSPYPDLYSINFANSSTGYIGGGLCMMQFSGVSYMYKTTNQGLNWSVINSAGGGDYIYYVSSFSIVSPDIFYSSFCGQWSLGGSVGEIKKTTNGGLNFSSLPGVGSHKSVSFINEQTGWTLANYADDIGKHYCYILKTTNSGNNWSVQLRDSIRMINFTKVKFFNENTGYAIGGGNTPNRTLFFKTTSGGVIWDTLVIPNSSKYYSMSFLNPNTGWICGSPYGDTSAIAKTTNGGQTWINQRKNINDYLTGIFMLNENVGYAVGYGGIILKTVSGGLPPDTASVKYFPMAVGNVYTYYYNDFYNMYYSKGRITKDSVMYGHTYYYCIGIPGVSTGWTRVDSVSGLLLTLYPGSGCGNNINDKIIDSLAARRGDSLNYCPNGGAMTRVCNDTSNITLFGNYITKRKSFGHDGLVVSAYIYAKNIGIVSFGSAEPPPIMGGYSITGCKINGVVYGDTNAYYSVSGLVRYSDNSQPATNGYVKAIKLDRSTGNIITYDSAQIQSDGSYVLSHVSQDSLDIGVYPNSTTQNDWVITYYPSTTYWQGATTLYPTGNLININVGAIRKVNSTNGNFVNGKVMRLTDSQFGNLKDAVLYAKNGNTYVQCAISDVNGVYHLPSLPVGNLKIIVNRIGFTNDSAMVNVTLTSNIDSINFYLYRVYVGVKQISSIVPSEYKLYQNYPNPFNPTTNIRYQITPLNPPFAKGWTGSETRLGEGFVTLKVYDILGKEVATLVNEKQSPGIYEVTFDGSGLSSGMYFYTLITGDFRATKRFVLIK
jgi:photosystem II stability/assembly factor-like uncharacterized protein